MHVGMANLVSMKSRGEASMMSDFVRRCGGYAVMDGGLATELQRHGADLNDPLWSAKCLIDSPHLILRVNLDYLEAGANIIASASYQATLQGFEAKGISREKGEALLRKSVGIACEAREIYYSKGAKGSRDVEGSEVLSKQNPVLVAASVGSYGAYLADGSEYSGVYGDGVTLDTLKEFHRRRIKVLAESGADIIAFEAIPSKLEVQVFVEILDEEKIQMPAWISFPSKDGINAVSGDSISECALLADSCEQVVAVGINCTPPRFILGLIKAICKVTSKTVMVYPNSGETYDGIRKEWVQSNGSSAEDIASYVGKWREAGASIIGGCCRTTPATIRAISEALSTNST